MADVFISYAREDRAVAEALAQGLSDEGWTVFWDRHIPIGKRFDEVLAAELESAGCVIVLWSKAANASQWVAEEAEEARERGRLLPAMIEAVEPPMGFRRLHAADLVGWSGERGHSGYRRLIGDVAAALAAAAAAAKPATPAPSEAAEAPDAPPPRRGLPRWLVRAAMIAPALAAAIAAALFALDLPPIGGQRTPPKEMTAVAAAIEGRWRGRVAYDWGVDVEETFEFRPGSLAPTGVDAQILNGRASFLGSPKSILEGRVDGRVLRFYTRWTEVAGDDRNNVVNRYVGTYGDGVILFTVTFEGGLASRGAASFTLTRAADAPPRP